MWTTKMTRTSRRPRTLEDSLSQRAAGEVDMICGGLGAGTATSTGSVVAVVVTCRAAQLLRECLDSVESQDIPPDIVLVIDNSATETPAVNCQATAGPRVVHVTATENWGPAGGFAIGLAAANRLGASHAWLLDDDIRPDRACLSTLLELARELDSSSIIFPSLYDSASQEVANTWGWVGLLVPLGLLPTLGLPNEALFWGWEDLEWIIDRTTAKSIPRIRSTTARVTVTRREDLYRMPNWKAYVLARNATFLALHGRRHIPVVRRLKRQAALLHQLRKGLRRSGVWGSVRWHFVSGILAGAVGRLGRPGSLETVDRPSSEANES